jgi:epoxyqueuosine reductase
MDKKALTSKIKHKALELGFAKIGITNAEDFPEYIEEVFNRAPGYDEWVAQPKSMFAGARPRQHMPEAKSIICAVYNYSDINYPEKLTASIGRAYLSRSYSPLPDSICGMRAQTLQDYLIKLGCKVDDSGTELPVRIACARAGIITYGRNNFAYADGCGSFIILYTYLIDIELEYDEPTITCKCPPNCHKCIDACPTGALYAPGKLIPQKCLLYSHMRGKLIPEEIRVANGTYIHGCDYCQVACPRNQATMKKAVKKDPFLEQLEKEFDLEKVLFMDDEYYECVVRPIMYNYIRKPEVFRRNAAIALGNTGSPHHVRALKIALDTGEPMVREAAAWALGRIGNTEAKVALESSAHRENERDEPLR